MKTLLFVLIILSIVWWFYMLTSTQIVQFHRNYNEEHRFTNFYNPKNNSIDRERELQFYRKYKNRANDIIDMQSRLINLATVQDSIPPLSSNPNSIPIQSIILTTWRSGSTFLGDVLNAQDGNFYHYEPLLHYGIKQIRDNETGIEAIGHIRKLLHCNYTNMDEYIKYAHISELIPQNTRYAKRCRKFCYIPEFLSESCKLYPLQSMKIVRLRLRFIEELLNDNSLNVKVLYLIRDPRGIMLSRRSRPWCPKHPDCSNRKMVCNDFIDDYFIAKKLRELYPEKFGIVHYENLALKPHETMKKILKFYNRPFTNKIKSFIDSHTKVNVNELDDLENTFRNSTSTPFQWMNKLYFTTLHVIQKDCFKALNLWNYKLLTNRSNITNEFKLNFYNDIKDIIY